MADRWMDERDREWRDRDWRRSEQFSRGYGGAEDDHRGERGGRWREDRSWSPSADDEGLTYEDYTRQGAAYGEDEDYGARPDVTAGGGVYGVYRSGRGEARSNAGGARFTPQDYTRGGYADEAGRADYGYASRSGRAGWGGGERGGRSYGGRGYSGRGYGEAGEWRRGEDYHGGSRYGRFDERRFDEERSYRARRGYQDDDRERWDERRGERHPGEGASDFLQRAGERISSWFRGDHPMRGGREEERGEPMRYRSDFGREARSHDRGHRGLGPKGYRRSDERINEEVHDRLTDDPWLDASHIQVAVKDGEVTLSGHVDNREGKHRAERLVEDLSGVSHVQNNLRVDPDHGLTGAGRGYGSSALEAEMRRNAQGADPGNEGASGASGRTSTGAAAERSAGESSVDPKAGTKR